MVERDLYTIIKTGIDWFIADPERVYNFFTIRKGLEEEEAKKVRDYFKMDTKDSDQWGGPPTVLHGFARHGGPFPCYPIVLMSDTTMQKYLGDDMEDPDEEWEDLDGNIAVPQAIYNKYGIEIGCFVPDSPDLCLYYYHLLRTILLDNMELFINLGYGNPEWTGRDINPQERYLPENMWARILNFTTEREEVASEAKGLGSSITGIYVNDGVTASVEKNVTPYQE